MATEECKELLSSGSQSENVENDLYDDVDITTTSIMSEKNGEAFQTALEDDKEAEEVNVNAVSEKAAEIPATIVDGDEKEDELGNNNAESDQKVEAINSSSNKETKKIVRKRKKNVEDASVSSSAKTTKKKMKDVSAIKMKEVPPCDKSTQGNAKKEVESDGKLESIGKVEDEVEKANDKDVKIHKKAEGDKAVKIEKKKIVMKAKGGSSNAESASTKPPNVAAVEATNSLDEKAKLNVKTDENLAAATLHAVPVIEGKDAEGTEDKPTLSATENHLKDDTAEKRSKKVDGMGLIFMCNAKTKKDCFKYNVFGLPESKKVLVAKIYKGMRLFLFDFDLKLLYGIYKATSSGGYNIEPKAFGSKFPSQVRFTVLRDSLPLPEEKFKAAIKENYTGNKFDCQLSSVQVRKLCKLFQSATASASIQKHRPGAVREVTTPSPRTKRSHVRTNTYRSPPTRFRHLSPPPPRALPLQLHPGSLPASLQPSFAYERPGDDYYYRRDRRGLDLEMRARDPPIDYRDSYSLYREDVLYREPAYPPSLPPPYAVRFRQPPRSPPRYLY